MSQRASISLSKEGIYWKKTFTAPPQIIPRFCTSSRVRLKSCSPEFFSFNTSAAMCSLLYSTAPPPMVPVMRPSFPTSILAPEPRGVEPEWAMTVTMHRSSPFLRRRAVSLSIALICITSFLYRISCFHVFSNVFCFSAEAYIPSVPGSHGFKRDDFRAADLYISASPGGHIRYIA